MKTIFFSIIFALVSPGALSQDENPLVIAKLLYEDSLKKIDKDFQEQLSSLGEKYAERLNSLKSGFQQRGDLESVLWIEEEMKAVRSAADLPEMGGDKPEQLLMIRGQYRSAEQVLQTDRDGKVDKLRMVYVAHLKTMQTKLTQENRIEEALEVREEVIKQESESVVSSSKIVATVIPVEHRFELKWGLPLRAKQASVVTNGLERKPNLETEASRRTKINNDGMILNNGRVLVEGMGEELFKAVQKTGSFTFTAELIPVKKRMPGPGRILSYSNGTDERNFTLGQLGRELVLRLRTSENDLNGTDPEFLLGPVEIGLPTKIVFTHSKQGSFCFRDGKAIPLEGLAGDYSNWEEMPLLIGNELGTNRPWAGTLLSFSVTNIPLTEDEARAASE